MLRLEWSSRASAVAGLFAVTFVVFACSSGQGSKANNPLNLVVSKVTKVASSQPIARTVALGPDGEMVPKVESFTPKDGYTSVLFQLDVTNSGTAPVTFEGVKLSLKDCGLLNSGLLKGECIVFYLLKDGKTDPTTYYMSIGNPGIQPKDEIKPGSGITWQLMTTVKETTKKLDLTYPDANLVMIEY